MARRDYLLSVSTGGLCPVFLDAAECAIVLEPVFQYRGRNAFDDSLPRRIGVDDSGFAKLRPSSGAKVSWSGCVDFCRLRSFGAGENDVTDSRDRFMDMRGDRDQQRQRSYFFL